MAASTILVGTIGQGVMRSADDGENWSRVGVGNGMHSDALIRCLVAHPTEEGVVFAGSDRGLYRSDDCGATWNLLDTAMNGQAVWTVAIDPSNADVMLAGTGTPNPAALYRSADGGRSWQRSLAEIAETCPAVGVPRPTAIAFDPARPENLWAGIEVDGVRRSLDGGKSWTSAAPQIKNPDIHNLIVTDGSRPRVIILTNDDVWVSEDDGENWRSVDARSNFPHHYPRCVVAHPDDPDTVFVSLGDSTPGRTGVVMRSQDGAQTWRSLPLPGEPNSAMWTLTFDHRQPMTMFAASRYGNLFRSEDGGDSWSRVWREFSEVSSLAVLHAN